MPIESQKIIKVFMYTISNANEYNVQFLKETSHWQPKLTIIVVINILRYAPSPYALHFTPYTLHPKVQPQYAEYMQ